MVLKGMWLQAYAYADPDERPFADLDLLVRRSELAAAEAVLVRLGYRLQIDAPGDVARLYVSPEGFQIDLHYDLFPDGLFTLRGEHLFLRGLQDTRLVGVPVSIPDPYDGFAHLVGHFAKGRHGPSDTKLLRDFEELARAFQLRPSHAAAHLVAGGLRRAGLYALQFHGDPDSFAARTRRALPADPLGQALVRRVGIPRRADEPAARGRPDVRVRAGPRPAAGRHGVRAAGARAVARGWGAARLDPRGPRARRERSHECAPHEFTQAVVLGAGLGTRLRPMTEHLPKPGVPLAHVPVAAHTIAHLVAAGVDAIAVNTHYLAEALEGALPQHVPEGSDRCASRARTELLGTGGGIRAAWSLLDPREAAAGDERRHPLPARPARTPSPGAPGAPARWPP
jgi:hypothetical protein